jgi:hypothetical protein
MIDPGCDGHFERPWVLIFGDFDTTRGYNGIFQGFDPRNGSNAAGRVTDGDGGDSR